MPIVSNQFDFSSDYTLGNLLAVSCSLFLGIAFIISENVRKSVTNIGYTRTLFLSAAITLLGISLLTSTPIIGFSSYEFAGLFLLGLIPTIFGHGFMNYAVGFVSPTIVASAPMGEPILATIWAYFLFNEVIGTPIIIGGGFNGKENLNNVKKPLDAISTASIFHYNKITPGDLKKIYYK